MKTNTTGAAKSERAMAKLVKAARQQNPEMSDREVRELAERVAESLANKGWRRG